jgi:hypothetical protein
MTPGQCIEAAFRHVDDDLRAVEEIIVASRSHSPFNDYLTQLSPAQQKAIEHGTAEVRTAMICILRQLGIVANDPHISTLGEIRDHLKVAAERLDALVDDEGMPFPSPGRKLEETGKLLGHMRVALVNMDRSLSIPPSTSEQGST